MAAEHTMPPDGTTAKCVFCRETVALRQGASGAHYWVRPDEPVDGQRRCLGGVPWRHDGNVWTQHKPDVFAWSYDAAGRPEYPARFTPRRTA
jgi:hypothetical protein